MGRSCFLKVLLVSVLLVLSFSRGLSRELLSEAAAHGDSNVPPEENGGASRGSNEEMDYQDPGPNTNPRAGYNFSPPSIGVKW